MDLGDCPLLSKDKNIVTLGNGHLYPTWQLNKHQIEPTAKTDKKEKVSKPQISKQIPLEMGTGGGGGGGKKGGSGGKKPLKIKLK